MRRIFPTLPVSALLPPLGARPVEPDLPRLATTVAFVAALLASCAGIALADDWSPPGTKIDDWAECLRARDPDQRAEACSAILGKARDRRSMLRALNGRGNALCATAERCAEAVQDFSAVVKLAPEVAGYHDNLARALRAAGRYEEDIQQSDRAIALAPTLAFGYVGKAKALELYGRKAEALDAILAAMNAVPVDAGLLEIEGKLLGTLKRYKESHAAFDRALQMQPRRVSVYVARADVESEEGRVGDAIRDLEAYPADGREAEAVRRRLEVLRRSHGDRGVGHSSQSRTGRVDLVVDAHSGERFEAPSPADVAPRSAGSEVVGAKPVIGTTCNLHEWLPLQRCIEEYHNENDPLPGGVPNPRRWNDELAAEGRALSASHPEVTWDRSAWNKLASEAQEIARTDRIEQEAEDEIAAQASTPRNAKPPASTTPRQSTGAIDTCDALGVLSVIRDLSEKAKKEQVMMLLLANIVDAHFEYTGIRQLSFDPVAEHRVCAMDRKLAVTYYPHTHRPPGVLDSPIRYEVDRQLDGNRGSYVTCRCDR